MKRLSHPYLSKHSTGTAVITLLLAGAFMVKLVRACGVDRILTDFNGFGYTEMLINYEGGFVRRGLFGQLLWEVCAATGLSPFSIVITVCTASFMAVAAFFVRRFRREGFSTWFLLSPLCYSCVEFIIRKDYLCYLLVLAIFGLLGGKSRTAPRFALVTALSLLGLFLHEAFLFFGVPLAALFMLSDKRLRRTGVAFVLLTLAAFCTLCLYKGSGQTAYAIIESWNTLLPARQHLVFMEDNSIGALTWDTLETMKFHLRTNFHGYDSFRYLGLFLQPAFALCAYYFAINFPFVVNCRNTSDTAGRQTRLSLLLICSAVCLLPMFTVLSCDYPRLYQYTLVAAFGAFLLLPAERIDAMFPRKLHTAVRNFNRRMNAAVVPTRGLLTGLLFVLALPGCGFDLPLAFLLSVAGTWLNGAVLLLKKLFLTLI